MYGEYLKRGHDSSQASLWWYRQLRGTRDWSWRAVWRAGRGSVVG